MSKIVRNQVVPHRRLLLKGLATLPLGLSAAAQAAQRDPQLDFRHTHTDERLSVAFRNRQGYIQPALQRIDFELAPGRSLAA